MPGRRGRTVVAAGVGLLVASLFIGVFGYLGVRKAAQVAPAVQEASPLRAADLNRWAVALGCPADFLDGEPMIPALDRLIGCVATRVQFVIPPDEGRR